MLCARECPDWCIYIDSHKEVVPATEPGQRDRTRNVLDRFAIDYSLCMYCGICIEACPFDALFWSPEFEYAEFDIVDLLHEKDRLRDWMWTVPPPPAHAANAEPPKEIAAAQKAVEKQAAAEAKAAADRAAAPPTPPPHRAPDAASAPRGSRHDGDPEGHRPDATDGHGASCRWSSRARSRCRRRGVGAFGGADRRDRGRGRDAGRAEGCAEPEPADEAIAAAGS